MKLRNCTQTALSFGLLAFALSSLALAEVPLKVAFEQDSSFPIVYLTLAIKGGAVSDPAHQSGLTNFLGQALLRGTQAHSEREVDEALSRMGAELEVETRAETLIYSGAVLSAQLDPFLNLLKEILTSPEFSNEEIKKLKSEVISTIEKELDNDSSLSSIKFARFVFQDHPYGNPILGKIKDIANLNRKQILAHYHLLFQKKSLVIAGTGDASADKISRWGQEIEKLISKRNLGSKSQSIKEVTLPINANRRRLLIIDKPNRTQTQIEIGQIGIRLTDPAFFPLYLGNHAFGGPTFSSILFEEIRVKRGWSYGANSMFKHGLQPRSWHLHLFPAEKDSANALAYSLKLIENLKERGLTEEQFKFAKKSIINNSAFMDNTPAKRVANSILEGVLDLPSGFTKSYGLALKEVTLAQVNESLKTFLQPDRLSISVLGTASDLKAPLAQAAHVPLEEVEVVPYSEDE